MKNSGTVDYEFAELCKKKMQRGDLSKICAILQMSYTTASRHILGLNVDPVIQSTIMDYFEQRDIASDRAAKYVRERIRKNLKQLDISGVITPEEIKAKNIGND